MKSTKYHHLRQQVQTALADSNLEKCFEFLAEALDDRTKAFTDYIALKGQLNDSLQLYFSGQSDLDELSKAKSKIRAGVQHLIQALKPEDVSLLRRIHDRIVIVACNNTGTDWAGLFSDAFFSNAVIVKYDDDFPEGFQNPDVIIFDNLACPGLANNTRMRLISKAYPDANLLYFGKKNPFEHGTEEEQEIFAIMANSNNKFTIHARLHELLEYRRLYVKNDA